MLFAIWAIARSLGLEGGYPTVQMMAYTPYVLAVCPIFLVAVGLLRQWRPLILGLIAFVALGIAVVPRALGGPDEVTGGKETSVMAFNLKRGHADLGEVAGLVREREIDLLALQEVTPEAAREIEDGPLRGLLPHVVVMPGRPAPGGAILSRFPLEGLGTPTPRSISPTRS